MSSWQIIELWFLYFVCYGYIGRIAENCYVYIDRHLRHADLDKPLFKLPVFPAVYGLGGVAIVLINQWFNISQLNILLQFIICSVICALIEYLSASLLEFIFGKNIWWDYSNHRFNIQGKIYLTNCLWFGVGGVLIISFFQPFLSNLLTNTTPTQLAALTVISIIAVVTDNIYATYKNHKEYNFDHIVRRVKRRKSKASSSKTKSRPKAKK